MNKKGVSFTGWTEGIILTVLFSVIVIGVVGTMNSMYGLNYQTGLSDNETLSSFSNFAGDSQTEVEQGEADFTSGQGLTLISSWSVILALFKVVAYFLVGGFIPSAFSYIFPGMSYQVGSTLWTVGLVFRMLWTISLLLIILNALFRRKI